ncbi:MAG: protein-L-isoaspartate(D-aspartate) O-methyltransferase [Thermodesulfobacteriota bacterium]|nr:protein-L-isoaspartate(D-aspartate) O-methyltransferase [Thermodesulfobacteriota bacterium]
MKKKDDWEIKRLNMVESQLKNRGIKDINVLKIMSTVPREEFVPENLKDSAYDDCPLSIGKGQTISQPYMVAVMTESLALTGKEKVLELGTGSGYQTAVLCHLARRVFSIERIPELADQSEEKLKKLGYKNFEIKTGNGTLGWDEEAPFDCIIVTAGSPRAPDSLKYQLEEGGRLVIPIGNRYSQTLFRITRRMDSFIEEEFTQCIFVPLIGKYGWGN